MGFWREEFSVKEIEFALEQIKKARIVSADGRVSLTSSKDNKEWVDYNGWISMLVSAAGFEVRTDTLKYQIVKSALFSPELPSNFTENDFREIAYRLRHQYQEQEQQAFRVAFPLWNLPKFLSGTKRRGDVTINFSPSQNSQTYKDIVLEREMQRLQLHLGALFTEERLQDLRGCSICLAHVRANSAADANERASQTLYEILGLVNLAVDGGKVNRTSFSVAGKLPVSDVLIGPQTTTHFSNGELTHEGFWHERWTGGPRPQSLTEEEWAAWEKRFRKLEVGVSTSPWSEDCKLAAARYFKAFSNPNLEESFLEGWRLFENISGSRYEKVSQQLLRASNVFQDNVEYLILGKHLALRRNLIAHGHAINVDDEETLAFQMLQFVAPFLERYILNGFGFRSQKEFWEFLELPAQRECRDANRAELERQLDLLKKASVFRNEKDK